jgi:hypothetical protein
MTSTSSNRPAAVPATIGDAARAAARLLDDAATAGLPSPATVCIDHYGAPSGNVHLTGHPAEYLRAWARHYDAPIDARPGPERGTTYATAEWQRYGIPWQAGAIISPGDEPAPPRVPPQRTPRPPAGIIIREPLTLAVLARRVAAELDAAASDGLPAPASIRLHTYTQVPAAALLLPVTPGPAGITALKDWAGRAGTGIDAEPSDASPGEWRAAVEWRHDGIRYTLTSYIQEDA